MNGYFSQLDGIVNKRKVSNRIRFMIQDVVDLRRNNWKPRREDTPRFPLVPGIPDPNPPIPGASNLGNVKLSYKFYKL